MEKDEIDDQGTESVTKNGDFIQSLRAGRHQTKVMTENLDTIENHYPQFIQDINLYTVRTAKLRDAGDEFVRSLHKYAQTESAPLKSGLISLAQYFSEVQDQRHGLVDHLEKKVVRPLFNYETKCKEMREVIQIPNVALKKEFIQHRFLERVKSRAPHDHRLQKAQANYRRASDEAAQSRQVLHEQLNEFEREKVRDLKYVFGDLLLSEMGFFTRALELFTRGYQELMKIDENETIVLLQNSLNCTDYGIITEVEFGPNDKESKSFR